MKRFFSALLSIIAGVGVGIAGEMEKYLAPIPFLPEPHKPLVVIYLDNSGSMKNRMYRKTDYDPYSVYTGIFNSSLCYRYDPNIPVDLNAYSGEPYDVDIVNFANGAFVPVGECDVDSVDLENNLFNGNFLNWLTAKRIDTARAVLVGGKVEDRNGYDYLGDGSTTYKVVANNEPGDTTKYFDVTYGDYSFHTFSPADSGVTSGEGYYPYAVLRIYPVYISDENGNRIAEISKISLKANKRWDWKSFKYKTKFDNPIVVLGPLSYIGHDPAVVAVKNIKPNKRKFKVAILEWEGEDGAHTTESTFYMVVEKGCHDLGNLKVFATSLNLNNGWNEINFEGCDVGNNPIILATVNYDGSPKQVLTPRIKKSRGIWYIALQNKTRSYVGGQVNIVAISNSNGNWVNVNGIQLLTDEVSTNKEFKTLNLGPIFANVKTTNGWDPVDLRYNDRDLKPALKYLIRMEEPGGFDQGHVKETIGYLLIKDNYNLAAIYYAEPKGLIQSIYPLVKLGVAMFPFDVNANKIYWGNKADGATFIFDIPKNPFVNDPKDNGGYRQVTGYIGGSLDDIVDAIEHFPVIWGTTPLAEGLWEISRYIAGVNPYYCEDYYDSSKSPYKNPSNRCSKAFVIIATDGEPYKDADVPYSLNECKDDDILCKKLVNYTDDYSCDCSPPTRKHLPPSSCLLKGDDCAKVCQGFLPYVAEFAVSEDLVNDTEVPNKQNLVTYTVAFASNTIPTILQETADRGEGKAYSAQNGEEFKEALEDAIADILSRSGSAVAIPTTQKKVNAGNTPSIGIGSILTQSVFQETYQGEDRKIHWIGHIYNWWYWATITQNGTSINTVREDNVYRYVLNLYAKENGEVGDNILTWNFTDNQLKIKTCEPKYPTGEPSDNCYTYYSYESLNPVVEFGRKLQETSYVDRKIYYNHGGRLVLLTDSQNIINDLTYINENNRILPLLGVPKECMPNNFFEDCSSWNNIFNPFDNPISCILDKVADCVENKKTYYSHLINWIRGKDYPEFRIRTPDGELTDDGTNVWKLGDAIYSSPLIVNYGNYTVVYVASNDGMLHAFKLGFTDRTGKYLTPIKLIDRFGIDRTETIGKELWAFIPTNAFPYFKYLANPNYGLENNRHLYTVDLRPYLVKVNGRKILIGGFRLGGATASSSLDAVNPPIDSCGWSLLDFINECCNQGFTGLPCGVIPSTICNGVVNLLSNIFGTSSDYANCYGLSEYFALDITDPENPELLWEFTAPDLGFTYSGPGIIRKKDETYVVFASGPINYNATYLNEDEDELVVYIFPLLNPTTDSKKFVVDYEPKRIGLSKAFGGRIFGEGLDINNDGYTDFLFIGYSIRRNKTNQYKGGILYLATGGPSTPPSKWKLKRLQYEDGDYVKFDAPITARVVVGNCYNKPYIFFGTGRWFFKLDNLEFSDNLIGAAPLKCQYSGNPNDEKCSIPELKPLQPNQSLEFDTAANKGWYYELSPASGEYLREKMLTDPNIVPEFNTVLYTTSAPLNEPCSVSSGITNFYVMDCRTGGTIGSTKEYNPIRNKLLKVAEVITQTSTSQIIQLGLKNFVNTTKIGGFEGIAPETPTQIFVPLNTLAGRILLWLEY